jgi:membrane protein YqaA with SNARE-associated domain
MLRKIYDRTLKMAESKKAPHALFWVSFAESSFFPIPPDVLLIPMALANKHKAFKYAAIATLASVLGGIVGYLIGWFFYDLIGKPILDFYGFTEKFQHFTAKYNEQGAAIVLFAGLTPFPYKVITIASGVTKLSFGVFVMASIVARSARFFLVCGLLYYFGPPIKTFIEKYLGLLTLLFMTLLIGGFFLVKYML